MSPPRRSMSKISKRHRNLSERAERSTRPLFPLEGFSSRANCLKLDSRYTYCPGAGCGGDDRGNYSNKARRASGAQPSRNPFRDTSKTPPGWSRSEGIPPARRICRRAPRGDKLYATDCAMGHGSDGHTPLRARIVLECEEWNSSEWDAHV